MGERFGVEAKKYELTEAILILKGFKEPPTRELYICYICLKVGKAKKMAEELVKMMETVGLIKIEDNKVSLLKEEL